MNTPQTIAAVCEKKLKNGGGCGVSAIGHCATCGEAFCLTHQAHHPKTQEGYVDECTSCFTQRLADAKERLPKAQARADEAREYFISGSARAALLRKAIQPVEISIHGQKLKKGIFGDRYIEVTFSQRGWILGEFLWTWSYLLSRAHGWGSEDSYENVFGKKFLTALPDTPMNHENAPAALIPVNKGPGGYESFYGQTNRDFPSDSGYPYSELDMPRLGRILENWPMELDGGEGIVKGWVWVELEQAVKRLAGEPEPRRVDQTGASGLLPEAIPVPPAPLTATQPARSAPLMPPYTLTQKIFRHSSMDVAPPDGIKQKKPYVTKLKSPSKMSGGLIFFLTLLLGVGWVWLFPPAVSLIFSFDHHVACNNPLPGIIGALSALLFYASVIAVLFAAPIGLSALIVGFLKKITHYEHDDEMHLGFRALAITVVAVIIIVLIIWFLSTCGFSQ